MNMHGQMMNLPMTLDARDAGPYANGYKQGHKDARHAAAEAALKADACIEALRAIVEQQRSMGFDGSPSDELMDEARRALAAVGAADRMRSPQ
jgi:hypothetical protein